jgi:predicted AlkP superfamily phosphohydrolase/phosphomutase
LGRRVFCIGLDGGTFDLVDRFVGEGRLPHLGRFLREGTRAELRSVLLPFTPQAWSSFLTGVNPGRHGIFGFKEKSIHDYSFQLVNARRLRSKTLAQMLGDAGKKVILLNVPMNYPPPAVNGIVVGGMDSPGINSSFTYPPEVKDEILGLAKDYVIHLHVGAGYLDSDVKRREAVRALLAVAAARERVILHLMDKYPWDLFALNFGETDQVQHHFWRYLGSEGEFRDAILQVYERIDEAVGRITAKLGDDVVQLVVSDHGAGAASNLVFFIDEWLRSEGLLEFRNVAVAKRVARGFLGFSLNSLSRTLSSSAKDALMRWFPGLRARTQGFVRRSLVDWSKTSVYSGEHPATLRVNLAGRDRSGIVTGTQRYEELRTALIDKLQGLVDPVSGKALIEKVYRREEVYHGPFLESAPDLILFPKDFAHQILGGPYPRNRHYRQLISTKEARKFFVNGTHRMNGMFIARGKDVHAGLRLPRLEITDLCPTILYSLGMPVPNGLDGRVVTEMFTDRHFAENPVRYVDYDLRSGGADGGRPTYTDEESRIVERSLRNLGYIE